MVATLDLPVPYGTLDAQEQEVVQKGAPVEVQFPDHGPAASGGWCARHEGRQHSSHHFDDQLAAHRDFKTYTAHSLLETDSELSRLVC